MRGNPLMGSPRSLVEGGIGRGAGDPHAALASAIPAAITICQAGEGKSLMFAQVARAAYVHCQGLLGGNVKQLVGAIFENLQLVSPEGVAAAFRISRAAP